MAHHQQQGQPPQLQNGMANGPPQVQAQLPPQIRNQVENQQQPPQQSVTTIRDNDVLLGRGLGFSNHIGNKRFLAVVDEYKNEYNTTQSYRLKKQISLQVMQRMEARGARFLELVPTVPNQPVRNVIEEGVWRVANCKAAEEKCKQALREKRARPAKLPDANDGASLAEILAGMQNTESTRSSARVENNSASVAENNASGGSVVTAAIRSVPPASNNGTAQNVPAVPPSSEQRKPVRPLPTKPPPHVVDAPPLHTAAARDTLRQNQEQNSKAFSDVLPTTLGNTHYASPQQEQNVAHARLALYQQQRVVRRSSLKPRQQQVATSNKNGHAKQANYPVAMIKKRKHTRQDGMMHSVKQEQNDISMVLNNTFAGRKAPVVNPRQTTASAHSNGTERSHSLVSQAASSTPVKNNAAEEEDDAVIALASLVLADRDTFTEEQLAIERASMTDAERAAALSDLFGKYSDVASPQSKRARNELDRSSIDFLVRQMWLELERIPAEEKTALTIAQRKCESHEFSDERLERFLRCTDFDAVLAAQRFVSYWEERRNVFGPKKFVMKMTLGDALANDLEAIRDGVIRLLPSVDESGRRMLFIQPSNRTKGRYSSESLVCCTYTCLCVKS